MAQRLGVTFVIMAGGRGERLWPLVQQTRPKVCLSPDGKRSLLRATIDRLRPAWPAAGWLIVTTQGQEQAVRSCLPPTLRCCVLVEPQIKNTAACITLAAVALAIDDPHRVMVVVPADHWVGDAAAFQHAVRAAIRAAVAYDTIATIGVKPTAPHAGLGYLCADGAVEGLQRVFWLQRFIEKPNVAMARRLIRRPRTYWNSGLFVGTADKFLECVTEWLPRYTQWLVPLAPALRKASRRATARQCAAFTHRALRAYRALEGVSFDHGVMDHLDRGIVVEGGFPWADLGSWEVWSRLGTSGMPTVLVDSRRVTVVGQGSRHLIATLGVRDLVIVHTPQATLICRPDQTQAVRKVVQRIASDPRLAPYR